MLRPLPRRLAPLPDESLVGLLLRLAHHNNVSPGTIVRHTGLSAHRAGLVEHIALGQQYLQPPEQRAEFARVAQLGEEEVDDLFLAPFGSRYGPLNTTLMRRQPDRILHSNPGVFRRWSRFCPRCLAGDSAIERAHGGSWKRLWKIPPVFACTIHGCLLRHNCPECSRPGLEAPGASVIPRIKDEELHPNQCRTVLDGSPSQLSATTVCGTRHDQSPLPTCSEGFLETALGLQGELLEVLSPEGPREVGSVGWMIDASQYFTDLHTVAGLITLTWPAARDLAFNDEHVRILEHDAQLREERRSRLHAVRRKFHYLRELVSPAPDSRAYAAATGIAHQILKGDDTRALTMLDPIHEHLQNLQGPMKAEGDRMRNSPRNSPPLRAALTRRTRVTIETILNYPAARDRQWRRS